MSWIVSFTQIKRIRNQKERQELNMFSNKLNFFLRQSSLPAGLFIQLKIRDNQVYVFAAD